jgi:glycolate oxidase iron-sulfur subunit
MSSSPPGRNAAIDLLTLADQCVLCGLCLPACPTYRIGRTEAESPRGRIALAKALATGALAPEPVALAHLDHCLGCLSCERVCPSGVQYGRLIDMQRRIAATAPDRLQRLIYALIARPRRLRRLARVSHALRLAHWLSPLAGRFARGRTGIARWIALIPPLPTLAGLRDDAGRPENERGRVGLFLGCVASAFDRDTHAAARKVLKALGYHVIEPPTQGCCGALPRHAGHTDIAATVAAATRDAFAAADVDTVLVSASGCYGSLRDLAFADSGIRVREIGEFLAADAQFAALSFAPLPLKAALHRPCSLDNSVRAAPATRALLQQIPQLDIVELPTQPRCCGAGGAHFLRYPDIADPLRDERIDQVDALAADLLLTSNIGCRLHLAGGLRARGRAIDVLHPITLLARQLNARQLKTRRGSPTPPSSPRDAAP